MKNKWHIKETDADLALMSKVLGISEITANVMANRNLRTKKIAKTFLSLSLEAMHDVLQMKDMEAVLKRISEAINAKEKIVIYGDYDADGVTSTVILHKILTRLGANVSYYIPHRQEEGYGLNHKAIEKLAAEGTRLIVAVDNGISAVEEVKSANALGMDTVIIDHHEPGATLPPAIGIVDPKQPDCAYPFKEMCAGGLAYKVAAALCAYLNTPFHERDELLVLATIATLCDIVDLIDENRIIVNSGMAILNANKLINPGLGSLITLRGYLEKPIDTFAVSFIIGPCLNASGRLERADLSVELLLAEDFNRRTDLAQKHLELNEARKVLTAECVERVLSQIDMENPDKILVISDEDAHESVAGIVAGRVREATNRPTIMLTQGDGAMKGSGRSVPIFNLYQALSAHRHLFLRFGGHAMAAGLTIPAENIPILRDVLNKDCKLTEDDFRPTLEIDRLLKLNEVTLHLSDELAQLAPFGKCNDQPLFVSQYVLAEQVRVLDEKRTLIFTFSAQTGGAGSIKGIAFGLNDLYAERLKEADKESYKNGGVFMDVVYNVEANVYNGRTSVQMRVRDFKIV